MASNLMLANWANKGVNLWAVDLQTITLIAGQATYPVDVETVVVLDAYLTNNSNPANTIDRTIVPVSRSEYSAYPNKLQEGFSTSYWFDRLLSPTITLYPVPDGTSAQLLNFYRVRRIQDAALTAGQTVEIPYLWMEAFADGLSARLSRVWKPEMAQGMKMIADESYLVAASQNIETAQQYITPQLSSYYRP